jgi:hypothetical protein
MSDCYYLFDFWISGVRGKRETGVNQGRWQLVEELAVYGVTDRSFHQDFMPPDTKT